MEPYNTEQAPVDLQNFVRLTPELEIKPFNCDDGGDFDEFLFQEAKFHIKYGNVIDKGSKIFLNNLYKCFGIGNFTTSKQGTCL